MSCAICCACLHIWSSQSNNYYRKNYHRETVLTILSDGTFGPESLQFIRQRYTWHARQLLKKVEYTQPFVLLIKHMPGQQNIMHSTIKYCILISDADAWLLQAIRFDSTKKSQPSPIKYYYCCFMQHASRNDGRIGLLCSVPWLCRKFFTLDSYSGHLIL